MNLFDLSFLSIGVYYSNTIMIDLTLYTVLRSLCVFYLFHTLNHKKYDLSSGLFLIALIIGTYYSTHNYTFESVYPYGIQLFITLSYYLLLPNKSLYGFISSVLVSCLSLAITYCFHLIFLLSSVIDFFDYYLNWAFAFDYNNFLFLSDAIIEIIIVLMIKLYKKSNLIDILLLIFVVSFSISSISLFRYFDYRPLIVLCVAINLIIGAYIVQKRQDYKQSLRFAQLENEVEKNRLIYTNNKKQYEQLKQLKHDIVSLMRKTPSNEEYLESIDQIIFPFVEVFSSNSSLNMILEEKSMYMKEKKIDYHFIIRDDLFFLNEDELLLMVDQVFNQILRNESLKSLELIIKKEHQNYFIGFMFTPLGNLSFEDYWELDAFKILKEKYKITVCEYKDKDKEYYSLNLVYDENSG